MIVTRKRGVNGLVHLNTRAIGTLYENHFRIAHGGEDALYEEMDKRTGNYHAWKELTTLGKSGRLSLIYDED